MTKSFGPGCAFKLTFWLRGIGTGADDSILIEEYYAPDWNPVDCIQPIPTAGTVAGPYLLSPFISRVRFTYTKAEGDLAFDDVYLGSTTTSASTTTASTTSGSTTTSTTTAASTTTAPTTSGSTTTASTTTGVSTTSSTTTSVVTTTTVMATPTAPSPTPTPGECDSIVEGFDGFDGGVRPSGWEFVGCDQDSDTYTAAGYYGMSSPALALDGSGDRIVTKSFGPGCAFKLTFWLRGDGTGSSDSLLVEEYYAEAWSALGSLQPLPGTGTVAGPYRLSSLATRVRFTYTKAEGDLAFDDVYLGATTTGTTTTTTTTTVAASPTPVPPRPAAVGDYSGDGTSDIALFRPSAGLWLVRGLTK
ncbi:MAG TPA: hypothetical protein PK636_10345, partial [bacterium]|nr:hypothetical protein [bacterium]